MDETTKVSEQSIPDTGKGRVGEHIHQLLHLAHTLVHAATTNTTTTDAATGPVDSNPHSISDTDTDTGPGMSLSSLVTPFGMDLGGLTDQECIRWAQDLEHLARFQQTLAIHAASEITHRTVAGRYTSLGIRGPVDMLTQSLSISVSEASRRIALADAILPTPDLITGTLTPAPQHLLGEAFFSGHIGIEQSLIVSKFVGEADKLLEDGQITQEAHDEVEPSLVSSGEVEDPDFLRRIGNRIMCLLDPDGQKSGPAELRAKQGIVFRRARRGLVGFSGHLTLEQHEIMMTILGRFANPNHHKDLNPPQTTTSTSNGSDGAGDGSSAFIDPVTAVAQDGLWAEGIEEFASFFNNKDTTSNGSGSNNDAQSPITTATAATRTVPGIPENTTPTEPPTTGPEPALEDARLDVGPEPPVWDSIWDDSGPLVPPPNADGSESTQGAPRGTVPDNAFVTIQEGVGYFSPGGIWIPSPGSGEMLEGLDPTDPESTDLVVADDRSYAQKLLDGIMDCLQLAARTDTLPLNGGLKAQLIITTTQEDLERTDGLGVAFTVHNGPVPLALFDQSLCDPEITRLTLGRGQEILNVGRTQRLFTPPQRKILLARDLGCSFPDCTAQALWCEAHHIIPWQEGGETNIANAALLCSKHHTQIHHTQWSMELFQGTPFFTAPYLLDPSQTPRRNTFHHGLPRPNYPTLRGQGWN